MPKEGIMFGTTYRYYIVQTVWLPITLGPRHLSKTVLSRFLLRGYTHYSYASKTKWTPKTSSGAIIL